MEEDIRDFDMEHDAKGLLDGRWLSVFLDEEETRHRAGPVYKALVTYALQYAVGTRLNCKYIASSSRVGVEIPVFVSFKMQKLLHAPPVVFSRARTILDSLPEYLFKRIRKHKRSVPIDIVDVDAL